MFQTLRRGLVCCLVLGAIVHRANADINWQAKNSGGTVLNSGSVPSGNQINITILSTYSSIHVYADNPTTETVGKINLSGSPSPAPTLRVHVDTLSAPPTSMYSSTTNAGGNNWNGISDTYSGTIIVSACIHGNLAQQITTDQLNYLYVGGAIQQDISATEGEFQIRAASVSQGADIVCDGNIGPIFIVSGSLLGSVQSLEGGIDSISVSGDIGTSGQPVVIYSATDVESISAANVYADIWPGAYWPFTGTLTNLTTTGDLSGTARTLGFSTMNIGRDLIGTLALKGSNPFPAGKTINIGRSLTSTGKVTVALYDDLGGQIIIDQTDVGGTWASGGKVQVGVSEIGGPIELTGPNYPTLSGDLGGGAVGLADFDLHDEDCVPANGSSHAFTSTTTVLLRHYGPVTWSSQEVPVVVEWALAGTEEWEALPTEDFTYTVGSNAREIIVTANTAFDFDALFDYRITPASGVLKCAGVVGTPDVAYYEFILYGM